MTTLKISDIVKTRSQTYPWLGTRGTIVGIVDNNHAIVMFDSRLTLALRTENLILVEPYCIFKEGTCQNSQEDKLCL
jgi:hypothetical protein